MQSNLKLSLPIERSEDEQHPETNYLQLGDRINKITRYQESYVKKLMKKFALTTPENTSVICDFITAEQNGR